MIGETIGNYKVLSLLGTGGMGEVFLAEQLAIETRVAIKVLAKQISRDNAEVQRFFNEARAVSKVKHAGTVKIFDCGFHAEHAYLVMEFLDGESLARRIARLVRLRGEMVAEIARQIAGVLDAVHAAGITHRDLKPDNIYIVPDHELAFGERIKVLDFGIAKLSGTLGGRSPITRGTMGTPAYMAPEQWNNSAGVDGRADVYSLGCVAFEMLCGWPPFPASSIGEACNHHLHSEPPRASNIIGQLPAALEALLDQMLAKTSDVRPSMKDVARIFEELRTADYSNVLPPPPPPPPAIVEPAPTPLPPSLESTVPGIPPGPVVKPPDPEKPPPTGPTMVAPVVVVTPPNHRTETSGEMQRAIPPRNRTALYATLGIVGVGGAAAAVWFATRPAPQEAPRAPAIDAPAQVVHADAAAQTADAASSRELILTLDPFVDVRGVRISQHQLTEQEYQAIASTGPSAAKPVVWITHAQATAACKAIGGRLPTSDEWERAAAGSWGITVDGVTGPMQEWTSTIEGGLAVVRGGYADQTPAQRAKYAQLGYTFQKDPGTDPAQPREAVASAHLGFRCVDAR